jgi:hypothetical protein
LLPLEPAQGWEALGRSCLEAAYGILAREQKIDAPPLDLVTLASYLSLYGDRRATKVLSMAEGELSSDICAQEREDFSCGSFKGPRFSRCIDYLMVMSRIAAGFDAGLARHYLKLVMANTRSEPATDKFFHVLADAALAALDGNKDRAVELASRIIREHPAIRFTDLGAPACEYVSDVIAEFAPDAGLELAGTCGIETQGTVLLGLGERFSRKNPELAELYFRRLVGLIGDKNLLLRNRDTLATAAKFLCARNAETGLALFEPTIAGKVVTQAVSECVLALGRRDLRKAVAFVKQRQAGEAAEQLLKRLIVQGMVQGGRQAEEATKLLKEIKHVGSALAESATKAAGTCDIKLAHHLLTLIEEPSVRHTEGLRVARAALVCDPAEASLILAEIYQSSSKLGRAETAGEAACMMGKLDPDLSSKWIDRVLAEHSEADKAPNRHANYRLAEILAPCRPRFAFEMLQAHPDFFFRMWTSEDARRHVVRVDSKFVAGLISNVEDRRTREQAAALVAGDVAFEDLEEADLFLEIIPESSKDSRMQARRTIVVNHLVGMALTMPSQAATDFIRMQVDMSVPRAIKQDLLTPICHELALRDTEEALRFGSALVAKQFKQECLRNVAISSYAQSPDVFSIVDSIADPSIRFSIFVELGRLSMERQGLSVPLPFL